MSHSSTLMATVLFGLLNFQLPLVAQEVDAKTVEAKQSQNSGVATEVELVLQAIEDFANDPLLKKGNKALRTIVRFVEANEKNKIVFDTKLHRWIVQEPQTEYAQQLMLAFIAGNMKAQLETGVVTDDTYSGCVFMFRVYHNIKKIDKDLKIDLIEEQINAYRKGELAGHIKQASSNRDSSDTDATRDPTRKSATKK